ncbi:AraC family transcriptional regulator, partial [Blautia producta]|nr:AraC family transcriptional regulator [Blautia producta]
TFLLKQIFRTAGEKKGTYKMQVMSLLCSFLFMLYDVLEHSVEEEAVSLPLLPAIDYNYDHYMEQIKVGQLADMCHFSESHFRKVFQKMKGLGPVITLTA